MKKLYWSILFMLTTTYLWTQSDYNAYYRQMNPAGDSLDETAKMEILHQFLSDARAAQDSEKVILANMYLANASFIKSDYPTAMTFLIEAEQFARETGHLTLLGRANHKKAAIYLTLTDYPDAIKYFELSLEQSRLARDTQNMAITLEQLGLVHGNRDEFDRANAYYKEAIPLVKKFCGDKSLVVTLSNYGNILCYQDSTAAAIACYEQALEIGLELGNEFDIIPSKQNLALEFLHLGELERALSLLRECLVVNRKNGWLDYLIYNYEGLAAVFEEQGQQDSALFYFQEYHYLKDSLIGADMHLRISRLEADNEVRERELELLRQEEVVLKQQQKIKNILWGSACFLILGVTGIGLLVAQRKRTRQELLGKRAELIRLAQILRVKNAELRDTQSQLSLTEQALQKKEDPDEDAIDPYNLKILTPEDWQAFKALFEKSYPGLLQKVRARYPDISEAEERLFLLLKLNLSSREIADILGVQTDTVKKTRNRLRKKLALQKEVPLSVFIQEFPQSGQQENRG